MLRLALLSLLLSACATRPAHIPRDPELGREYLPADEQQHIDVISEILTEQLEDAFHAEGRPVRRPQHTKQLACLKARLVVASEIPKALRHGVFAVRGSTYSALLRLSNGGATLAPDKDKTARGVAVKLFTAEGKPLQDFTFLNHPVSFMAGAQGFAEVMQAVQGDGARKYFLGWNPFRWHIKELRILLRTMGQKITQPLAIRYYSQLPARLGPTVAVKHSLTPCSTRAMVKGDLEEADGLRKAMVAELAANDVCFQFQVQPQTDAKRMPIEDARIPWSEKRSPPVTVAWLMIPQQNFDTPAQDGLCETHSFAPGRSMAAHQPLGGVSRARQHVYQEMARIRQFHNKQKNPPTKKKP
jgi:hypothetical protein